MIEYICPLCKIVRFRVQDNSGTVIQKEYSLCVYCKDKQVEEIK